jgi:hypothetical protein
MHCRGSTSSPLGWQSLATHTSLVLSLSKGGRACIAVVRQVHHWVGGYDDTHSNTVLSLSKDGGNRYFG